MKHRFVIPSMFLGVFALLLGACTSGGATEKTIFVGPATVECVGVAPQRCLLIKENPNDPWELWYHGIEGFDFEEGYVYELSVDEQVDDNPPADASAITLTLNEVISKEPVAIKTMFIGPERVDCEGEGPQKCYLYKENPEDDWLLFYSEIEGFRFEEGFEYELRVAEIPVENPPAGGSSIEYVLVEEVSKTEAQPELIGTIWALVSLSGQPVIEGSDIVVGIAEERIGGFAGCNTYFGPVQASGNQVQIGPLGVTRLTCLDESIMAQESDYLAALDTAASYAVSGDQLEVANSAGETIMSFERVDPAPLEGTLWELVTYNDGSQAMVSPLNGTRITATFDDAESQVAGSAGCNNYFGGYEVDGNSIAIGPLASTQMFCGDPEGVMEQESQYLAALQSAATFQIIANRLELISESGELAAMFTAAEPATIEGSWQVIGYNNGREAVVSVIIGTELTADFVEGTVSGSAGCNNYTASYEVGGDQISIGPAATTRMACGEPEGIMEQENEFLAALQTAATYRIDGDRMEMRDESGALAVSFVAAGDA